MFTTWLQSIHFFLTRGFYDNCGFQYHGVTRFIWGMLLRDAIFYFYKQQQQSSSEIHTPHTVCFV